MAWIPIAFRSMSIVKYPRFEIVVTNDGSKDSTLSELIDGYQEFYDFDPRELPLIEGEALGHPLLDRAVCVANDLHLAAPVRVLVVSGSNMSGKSTFLRSVGTACVLAFAGGPVCARSKTRHGTTRLADRHLHTEQLSRGW